MFCNRAMDFQKNEPKFQAVFVFTFPSFPCPDLRQPNGPRRLEGVWSRKDDRKPLGPECPVSIIDGEKMFP